VRSVRIACQPDPEVGRATLVRLSGYMDAVGATQFWDEASPQIVADRPSMLVDMSDIDFLSSSGITTLIQLLKQARPLGGRVSIFGCKPTIRKVLRIVSLEEILNVCDTAEDARRRVN